jgi:ADP-ribose 1''-phosphate phosphatase
MRAPLAKSQLPTAPLNAKRPNQFDVDEIYDTDFFAVAKANSILVHACNCQGSWGGGIAKAFAQAYPNAYSVYKKHCKSKDRREQLRGTALLIAPLDDKPHWIGCIMTSASVGRHLDSKAMILQNTKLAMKQLLHQIQDAQKKNTIKSIQIAQINAGLFKVPVRLAQGRLDVLLLG